MSAYTSYGKSSSNLDLPEVFRGAVKWQEDDGMADDRPRATRGLEQS